MLKLHNSLTNKVEDFVPIDGNKVSMYVCGPTVYDNPHLGHARCYITWDVLYRYLKFLEYDVTYCRNITDIDDKILAKAKAENSTPKEISEKYYNIFSESMDKLHVLEPKCQPKATDHIKNMEKMVEELINKGYAYEVDGDVYFRVDKFEDYGKLSKQPIKDLVAGARVEASTKKENVLDFALWKRDDVDGFENSLSKHKGRPGWHIECSAMAKELLGEEIDIHAGGADLIFPHHENEIAQSCCANDTKQFAKYWLHNGFVTINKEKMSKSLQNFVSIDSLLDSYDANTIRFFILTNHYRMPVEFNDEALEGAKAGFKRLQNALDNGIAAHGRPIVKKYSQLEKIPRLEEFVEAMDNDLNTSVALSTLFKLATLVNTDNSKIAGRTYFEVFCSCMDTLGFTLNREKMSERFLYSKLQTILPEMDFLSENDKSLSGYALMDRIIEIRNKARAEKNWPIADAIRNALDKISIVLKDSKDGTVWEKK